MRRKFDKLGHFDEDGNRIQRNGKSRINGSAPEDWEIKEEMLGTLGNLAMVAMRLDMDRKELVERIERSWELRDFFYEMRQTRLDAVENSLYTNAISGNVRAQIFYLRTQGRDRGYGDVQTNVNVDIDSLNLLQLKQLAQGAPLDYVLTNESVPDERTIEATSESYAEMEGESGTQADNGTDASDDVAESDFPEIDI